MSGEEVEILRLDHMPVVGHALRRLGIAKIVDDRCPKDPRSHVSAGQCVEALIAAILTGTHTLYRIADLLRPFDLKTAFGWSVDADHFHDERLQTALDEVVEQGLAPINAAATLKAVEAYTLDLGRVHFDTTSLTVFGDYRTSVPPEDPEDPEAIPHVTYGHSKDRYPDMKQVVYGLTVTSDAVPIYGRVASGNRNDSPENRFNLRQLALTLPDPRATTLVADSKFFAGETIQLASESGFRFVTLMPKTVGLWGEAYALWRASVTAGEGIELLREREGRTSLEPVQTWRGRSFDLVYHWEDDQRVAHDLPLRAVVVESSQLRELKRQTLERERKKEREALEKAALALEKKDFHCENDAQRATEELAARPARFHDLEALLRFENRPKKRARRGRPRQGEVGETEEVWRAVVRVREKLNALEGALDEESCFVLATTLPREGTGAATDAEVLHAYREQNQVEGAMKSIKGPLAVVPIFLKTPSRIAALGLVYVLALMTYALIQRDARIRLDAAGATMAGNNNVRTARPTTEVIFRLFEGILSVRSPSGVTLANVTTEQERMLRILESPLLTQPGVHFPTLKAPRPGQRGHKPK